MLHSHLYLYTALSGRTSGQMGEASNKAMLFQMLGEHWAEMRIVRLINTCTGTVMLFAVAKTAHSLSNDQAVYFTVMNIPCKQSGLEGYVVQIKIAFHVLCIAVMQDNQYVDQT